jgi:hypothetical protein
MPWSINGDAVQVSSWRYDAGQLNLKVRVHTRDDESETVRQLSPTAGDYSTITYSDSTREVVSSSDDLEEIVVTPPERLRPFLLADSWTLKSYSESAVDGGSLRYDVTLTLARLETRGPASDFVDAEQYGEFSYGTASSSNDTDVLRQSPSASDWAFRFQYGDLAVDEGRITGGEQRARQTTFRMQLTPSQGEVFLETLGTSHAVEKVDVQDGEDYYVDNQRDDRNTVEVQPPTDGSADEYLEAGEYAVTDWRIQHDPETRRWQATLGVAQLARQATVGQLGGVRYGEFNYGDSR